MIGILIFFSDLLDIFVISTVRGPTESHFKDKFIRRFFFIIWIQVNISNLADVKIIFYGNSLV